MFHVPESALQNHWGLKYCIRNTAPCITCTERLVMCSCLLLGPRGTPSCAESFCILKGQGAKQSRAEIRHSGAQAASDRQLLRWGTPRTIKNRFFLAQFIESKSANEYLVESLGSLIAIGLSFLSLSTCFFFNPKKQRWRKILATRLRCHTSSPRVLVHE